MPSWPGREGSNGRHPPWLQSLSPAGQVWIAPGFRGACRVTTLGWSFLRISQTREPRRLGLLIHVRQLVVVVVRQALVEHAEFVFLAETRGRSNEGQRRGIGQAQGDVLLARGELGVDSAGLAVPPEILDDQPGP